MDIGTAKPSAEELAKVPHHLIDIRDPLHAYSAAEFVRDATTLMADIRSRGKLPLLVGGTMLYRDNGHFSVDGSRLIAQHPRTSTLIARGLERAGRHADDHPEKPATGAHSA
eukprot:gene23499-44028_t